MASPMMATVPARTGREITPTKPPLWIGPHAVYNLCVSSISEPKCTMLWRTARKVVTGSLLRSLAVFCARRAQRGGGGGSVNAKGLPQLAGRPMVTDGGMGTRLIFHHGG